MKINEIIAEQNQQARVSKVQGDRVTIDHGDGTETTIDTKKNPDALDQDEQGNIQVRSQPSNSAMKNKQRQQQRPRPGQRVTVAPQ